VCQLCLTLVHHLRQELLARTGCVEFPLQHIDQPL
jgi:hypothetical protein